MLTQNPKFSFTWKQTSLEMEYLLSKGNIIIFMRFTCQDLVEFFGNKKWNEYITFDSTWFSISGMSEVVDLDIPRVSQRASTSW